DQPPVEIYVKEKAVLNQQHERAYQALGIDAAGKEGKRKGTGDQVEQARGWMCRNFFDVRTFGAVMSTGTNCGQVRGPVQITFGRSIDPVVSSEHAITRMAVTTDAEAEKQQGDNRTMGRNDLREEGRKAHTGPESPRRAPGSGRKFTVPYGLYRAHGFVSAPLAEQTGFSDDDLELLWKSLEQMFEHDHSAARGQMSSRGLLLFKHDDRLGNAPAHTLFDRVAIERTDTSTPARDFSDYRVLFDGSPIDDVVAPGAD
ncbi:MAG: type I CRISPR-associated protein Cas7, partial [Phycisphaerales bacterium]|nr:type I CRISPR-associated protein Cas7 [Phycisphaerales bacterium]